MSSQQKQKLTAIRCDRCGARLLDTDGKADREGIGLMPGIVVQIKCWRCKEIRLIHLRCDQERHTIKVS